jgi:hypothetical protein
VRRGRRGVITHASNVQNSCDRFNSDGGVGGGSVSTMSRKVQVKKRLIATPTSVKPLVTVPFENGFHFYTDIGSYTGITATNLNEFEAKLQIIPEQSIKFHFQRKDFQKWIKDTIKDEELAEKIDRIREAQSTKNLRKKILRVTQERISELTRLSLSQDSVMTNLLEDRITSLHN